MIDEINFTVPGDPVPKGRPKFTTVNGRAKAYTPKKTKHYEEVITVFAKMAMRGAAPLAGPVSVKIGIFLAIPASWSKKKKEMALVGEVLPTTKSADVDNVCKSILDGMNGVVFIDDALVVNLFGSKCYSIEPRVEIQVLTLAGKPA